MSPVSAKLENQSPLAQAGAEDFDFSETLHESQRTVVYRGVHKASGTPVIAKLLRSPHPGRQEIQAYEEEFQLISQFCDPGIVSPFSLIDFRTSKAIIMADDHSISLSRFLRDRSLPLLESLDIARALAQIIATVHAQGVVIRDIKPDNFIINPQTLKLKAIDFGLATRVQHEIQDALNPERLEGTLAYLSPEQTGRMNRSVDFRTDFYSLGVSFYELFTSTRPFNFEDPLALVHAHIALEPVAPHQRDPRVPPALSALILKLMEKVPEKRYQSAQGLLADLDTIREALATQGSLERFEPGLQDLVTRFSLPEKLYGREAEELLLFEEFERASGGELRFLALSGPPGIGKSFLINELQKPLAQQRGYFLVGKFERQKREIPYSAFIQALNRAVRQVLGEPEEQLRRIKQRLEEQLGDNAWLLAELAPEWQLLLGECPAIEGLPVPELRMRFQSAIAATLTAFTSRKHPVILFLDDLQWADQASVALLDSLLRNLNLRHILIIGSSRPEEIDAQHPVHQLLLKLRADGINWWREHQIPPLGAGGLHQLLADCLALDAPELERLKAIIEERTGGNPFFVKEFLRHAHQSGLVRWDNGWRLDFAGLEATSHSENILQLLIDRIRRQDRLSLGILKQLSAIGCSTEIRLLEHRIGCIETELLKLLVPAIADGLVIKQGELLRFTHDRIHEAVYTLLDPEERTEAHHAIGNFLLQRSSATELRDRLFDIVHQLNLGLERENDPAARLSIANLNIMAGRRAKSSTAWDAALAYYRIADRLLPPSTWESDYRLMLDFQSELSQTEYLCGESQAAGERFGLILARARDDMDKIPTFLARMTWLIAGMRLEEAFETGRDALALLGIRLPRRANLLQIGFKLLLTQLRLRSISTEKLATLPPLKSPRDMAAMQLLMALTEPVYHGKPDYLPLLVMAMIKLTMRRGNSAFAAYAYSTFAIMTQSILGNIPLGERIGELAARLVDASDSNWLKGKVHFLNGSMVSAWTKPLPSAIAELVESYTCSIESGDILWAAYALDNNLFYTFLKGDPLDLVCEKFERNRAQIRKLDQKISWECYDLWYQLASNFQSESMPGSLSGDYFNEAETIPGWVASQDHTGLGYYALCRLIQACHLEDWEAARRAAEEARAYLQAMVGMYFVAVWHFYHSLALLGPGDRALSGAELRSVRRNQRKMTQWAEHSPANFRHRWLFIQALLESRDGKSGQAALQFDQALIEARRNGFLQDAALICEAAGRHWLAQKAENLASSYLSEAWHSYKLWNGNWQANRIMERYRSLVQTSFGADSGSSSLRIPRGSASLGLSMSQTSSSGSSSSGTVRKLDLMAILKAANALMGAIDQEQLHHTMMKIVMESAGAQRAVMVLRQAKGLFVSAIAESSHTIVVNTKHLPLAECGAVDQSIVTFVERTRKPVVWDPANPNELFQSSSYFQENQPSSVLCLPIVNQGRLIGILYLENRHSQAVFSPNHLEILQLLSSQIGTAIENARLFDEQRQLTKVYSRYVPMEFLKLLGKESILDVKLADQVNRDMTIMFADIRSFTSLSEQMTPAENFNFLNSYLARISPLVRANHGFIDKYLGDGLMALFPVSELDAIQAGIAIQRSLAEYNQGRQLAGHPAIGVGIGIHSGSLMLGTIGESERMETTVISDSVNIASRLEALSKRYGVAVLVSEQVVARIGEQGRFRTRFLDKVVLVGKNQALAIYEVIDPGLNEENRLKAETLAWYQDGVRLFYERDFAKAGACFERVVQRNGLDNPARLYLDRCSIFTVNPPPETWTGTVVLVDK